MLNINTDLDKAISEFLSLLGHKLEFPNTSKDMLNISK